MYAVKAFRNNKNAVYFIKKENDIIFLTKFHETFKEDIQKSTKYITQNDYKKKTTGTFEAHTYLAKNHKQVKKVGSYIYYK